MIEGSPVEITREDRSQGFDLWAKWRDRQVGYAYCGYSGDRIHLQDLKVPDDLMVARVTWLGELNNWLPFTYRSVHVRRKGIGTALLRRVVADAIAAGKSQVWGYISDADADHLDVLLGWYSREGFTIGQPDEECNAERALRKITRNLP
jgi:hypothetical protein